LPESVPPTLCGGTERIVSVIEGATHFAMLGRMGAAKGLKLEIES
jgi:hypothetical protein